MPLEFNFGFDIVDKWAEDRTKLALISVDQSGDSARYHTFYTLSQESNRFANVLRGMGLRKGDRALVILNSVPEWYIVMIGMIKLGVVPMPGTTQLTPKDIEYRLNRSEATMVITDMVHTGRIERVVDKCPSVRHLMSIDCHMEGWTCYTSEMAAASPLLSRVDVEATRSDDPMWIYFTSGTTGHPKMVLHAQRYALAHEVTARYAQDLRPTDLHWTVSDTGWAKAAWGKLFGQMIVGAAIIQWETPGRFVPDKLLELMERYGVTSFCAPPTVYRMLIQKDLRRYRLTLRHCMSAGEPLNPEVIRVWHDAFGLEIYDFYGQTETVCIVANTPRFPLRYGSMGKPTPGHDVRIVDDEGGPVPDGEEGNIAIYLGGGRPPGLMLEYWKDPEEMAKAFRGDFYYTGDRGYVDADGYFWFVGRSDDVIKSSGYRIGPFEVESALMTHPAVAECAVVGVEDPEGIRGIVVKANVVLAHGYEPSEALTRELQDHVKKGTAPYKYPRIIEYAEDLPKTVSGKILRRELRKK
ncbi:MAG: AMP-binding protein [Thermoplasmata archaeon]|nr:AMP-binding protein [Thermoplasmata archaeon]